MDEGAEEDEGRVWMLGVGVAAAVDERDDGAGAEAEDAEAEDAVDGEEGEGAFVLSLAAADDEEEGLAPPDPPFPPARFTDMPNPAPGSGRPLSVWNFLMSKGLPSSGSFRVVMLLR